MSCQPYADALVDSSVAAPADLKEHLEGCADCRGLAAGHVVAAKLGEVQLPELRSPRVAPRLFAVAAAALVAVVGFGAFRGEPPRPSNVAVPTETGAAEAEWAAFTTLHRQTSSYARADTDALGSFHQVGQYFALERLSSRSEALFESSTTQESP